MGMFDDIRCDVPLPDGEEGGSGFQTKDLDCDLENYVITAEGRLVKLSGHDQDPGSGTDMNYEGSLVFYGPDGMGRWRQFRAEFTDGQLFLLTFDP